MPVNKLCKFQELKDVDGSMKIGRVADGCQGINLADFRTSEMLGFGRSDLMGANVLNGHCGFQKFKGVDGSVE